MAMNDSKLGIGIIGAGFWGSNLVRNFFLQTECLLKVVCDLDQARLDRQLRHYHSVRGTRDASELIASTDVDAVVVCTPPETHFELTAQALNAGKHVFVAKPLTFDPGDALKLVELADQKERLLHVDHTFLYANPVRKVRELISDPTFGPVNYVEMTRTNTGLIQPGVNVVWDFAPHDVSILNYLLERLPNTIVARTNSPLLDGYEHLAYVTLHYDDGLIAQMQLNWLSPLKVRRAIVGGSQNIVVYDESQEGEKVKLFRQGGLRGFSDSMRKNLYQHRMGDIYAPFFENREPLSVECEEFIDAAMNGGKTLSSGAVAYDVVRLVDAIDQSLKSGGREVCLG